MQCKHILTLSLIVTATLGVLTANTSLADESCSLFQKPFTAVYYGSYKGWRLDATQQLAAMPKHHWQITLNADNPIGSINQQSIFILDTNNRISSERYRYQRKVLLKNEILETAFNWETQQATSTRGESVRRVKLQDGELDALNYQLALRCDLLAGKTEFRYNVVDWNEIDVLDFKVVGEEKLDTEIGSLDTVVVKRIRNNNNRITTLWFAKALNYQMVKLMQEERKDTEAYLLYIKSLNKP